MKSEIRAAVTNIKRLPGCKIPFVVRRPFDMSNCCSILRRCELHNNIEFSRDSNCVRYRKCNDMMRQMMIKMKMIMVMMVLRMLKIVMMMRMMK
jgi:hypothetical protein